MQKFNVCNLPSKIHFRNYSGEYRIFHFIGFGKKIENNLKNNESKSPATTRPQSAISGICLEPTHNTRPSEVPEKTCQVGKSAKKLDVTLTPSKETSETGQKSSQNIKNTAVESIKKPECTLMPHRQFSEKNLPKKPERDTSLKQETGPQEKCNVKKPEIPKIKLNDGNMMPMLGLGTWGSKSDLVFKAIKHAINVGYRMIDCAHVYENEQAVGKAINECIKEGIIKRDELFITSKLWNTFHRPEMVLEGCRRSLNDLNLSYLDLYLIHWPMGYKEGKDLIPYDACGRILCSLVDYIDTWKSMEDLVQCRLVRSIGISNFNKKQTERILKIAKVKPVVNQVECHPYFNQMRLMAYLKMKKIVLVAYSPLGSPARPWAKPDDPYLMEENVIKSIGAHHGRTAAQICIRYQIQRGNAVIPKSVTPSRIESNLNVLDFELDGHEMKIIDKLDKKLRLVQLEKVSNHPHYPFHDEY